VPAKATFKITVSSCSSSKKVGIDSVTVGGVGNILSAATGLKRYATELASELGDDISKFGYTAQDNGNGNVTISAPLNAGAITSPISLTRTSNSQCTYSISPSTPSFSGYQAATPAQPQVDPGYPGAFVRTDITPGNTYPKVTARIDCTGDVGTSGCSYSEEMTNFANWWTYYHTRMQGMKTAASLAFKPIDNRYRVGFITIANQSSNYLPIADFGATQKSAWYTKLFKTNPSTATPLRSALSIVGRIFAGKNPVSGYNSDPAQYSCQQNFALLTTDGYWNTDSNSDVKDITGSASVGNLDGTGTPRPMYEGGTASSNSLADVAKYYYDTDLRTPSLGNCTGSLGVDVCTNNVFVSGTDNNVNQHMTTFTLGLGVDGSLVYTSDYMVATQGDFFDIKTGTKNWSVPAADSERAIDDLWHAAVNGQGIYFSAKNPDQLATSLSDALSSLDSKVGAGAAAAASNLSPVDGDNFSYLASYRTTKWTGNLEGRTIDVTTGKVSQTATWCAEDVVSGSCSAPGSIIAEPSGASNVYNCVTPGATAATCVSPGVLVGTECKVEVPVSCSGTMSSLVGAATDTRAIKMKSGSNLVDFLYINLTTAQKAYFDSSTLSNLSQWGALNSTQRGVASGANLVHFLRGQTGYENRTSNSEENRLFRYREAALGDAGESTPTFVGKPIFNYLDAGYDLFKAAKAARLGTVYLGLNDGMLHAFDSETGTERWAYVPSMVMPNMWKLADRNYATMHTYYVNGDPITGDICTANCDDVSTAVWRTILIGGLNAGGKGYYALDITDPGSPSLLWEFDTTSDNDLGYTFGNPVITKKANGDWVVLVTSGYNNTTGSNPGKGYLYVLDAMTGTKLSKIGTGVGDATTPSGLARFASSADNPLKNNTTIYTYGGDLLGNVWRFDINSAEASGTNPFLLATLKDASGDSQPVTNRPELGKVSGKSMVFVGTGKYLEATDLTNTQRQTLYAIKDENASATLENARNHLVQQVLTTDGASRTISNNPVNLATGRGWYVDFPDEGERQHIPAQLVSGSLLVPTVVPEVTVCTPGGYSWFNYFRPGGGAFNSTNVASTKADSVIVGFNVYHIDSDQDGHTSDDPSVVNWVTNKGDQLTCPPDDPDCKFFEESLGAFNNKRGVWRELTQ
jgi:type IV pilus assembly protein PilY1